MTFHLSVRHPNYEVRMEHLSVGRRLLCSQNTGDRGLEESAVQLRVALLRVQGTKQGLSVFSWKILLFLDLAKFRTKLAVRPPGWQLGHILIYSPWPRGLCVPLSPSCLWFAHMQQQLHSDFQDLFQVLLGALGLCVTSNSQTLCVWP